MSADRSVIVVEHIVQAIAEAEETEPENLDISLQEYVSTDAIRELVAHQSEAWRLQFETVNHVVEVTGNDTVLVDSEPMHQLS